MKLELKLIFWAVFPVAALVNPAVSFPQIASPNESASQPRNTIDDPALRKAIERAKAEGRSSVVIESSTLDTGIRSVNDLITGSYAIIVAEPIERLTSLKDRRISTWYKLRIIERIADQTEVPGGSPPTPDEMLPTRNNEVLLQVNGGHVTVDDVVIKQADQVSLVLNHQYLIYAYLRAGGKLASLAAGKNGVFEVVDNMLTPLGDRQNPLTSETLRRYNSRLDWLREDVRRREMTSHP